MHDFSIRLRLLLQVLRYKNKCDPGAPKVEKILFWFLKGLSRDGLGFWWHVWLVLGLNRGRGHFVNFAGTPTYDFIMQKYFSRLMRACIGLILSLRINKSGLICRLYCTTVPLRLKPCFFRPELVESTYLLYQATKNPFYLHVGRDIIHSLNNHTRCKRFFLNPSPYFFLIYRILSFCSSEYIRLRTG